MKTMDYILMVVILLAAVLMFIYNIVYFGAPVSEDALVVIRVDGELFGKYPLNMGKEIIIGDPDDGHYNIIQIKDSTVTMLDADCRDQVCVNTRPITKAYQTIVCLPYRVMIEIEGTANPTEEEEIDDISR